MNTRRKTPQPLDPEMDVLNSPEFKFGRLLASPDARIRHATILKLQSYLQARCAPFSPTSTTTKTIDSSNNVSSGGRKRRRKNDDGDQCDDDDDSDNDDDDNNVESGTAVDNGGQFRGLSELDLLKLWKGLWHTLYLCDGVSVQEEVSKVLAKLMWSLAGSEEQDEYAGRLYLAVDDDDGSVEWGGDDSGGGEGGDKDQMAEIIVDQESDKLGNDSESQDNSSSASEGDDNQAYEEDDISQDESDTKHCRGAHLSQLFIRTYFQTLTREWYTMDKYRIDKFYTLTRLILRETYRYMAVRHWNLGIIRLFNDALFEEVLRPTSGIGGGGGNGVRFHLLDICLEELALVNAEEATGLKLTEATFLDCLEPFFELWVKAQDKLVHDRVMEKVVSRFLIEFSVVSDNYSSNADDEDGKQQDEDDKDRMLVMDEVHVGSVAQFIFELASDPKTLDRYRKELYDMHKTYARRIKEVGRDVSLDDKEDDELLDIPEEGAEVKDKIMDEKNMIEVLEEKEDIPSKETRQTKKAKKAKKQKAKVTLEENKKEVVVIEVPKENEGTSLQKAPKMKKTKKQKVTSTHEEGKKEDGAGKPNEEKVENMPIGSSPKDNKTEETDKNNSSSKKRRKKKKKNSGKEVVPESPDEKEDVITITVDEQNEAVNAATKSELAEAKKDTRRRTPSKKKDEITVNNDTTLETPKKVKFRKLNMSKSYKASMKDLKKIDHKAERTPEKSILMKKVNDEPDLEDKPPSASKKSNSSKKKRKRNKTLS